jgi:hypothetical protein
MFLHRGLLLSKLIVYIHLNKNYNYEIKIQVFSIRNK